MRSITLTLCLALAGIVSATTLEQLSVDKMIEKSASIVRGKVVSSVSVQRGSLIYTTYRFQVTEQMKGSASGTFELSVPGGDYGKLRQNIPGAPRLLAGKEYVVFVWTSKSGINHIIGLSQGLFDLRTDPSGDILLKQATTDARMVDTQSREVDSKPVSLTLGELQRRVKAAAR